MTTIGEGPFMTAQFGLGYILVLTMLAFLAVVTSDRSVLRRQMMSSAPLLDAMNGLADFLFDVCRRTARIVSGRGPAAPRHS